jgi:hypothetical protein
VIVALAFLSLISGAIDQYFYPGEEFPPTALAFLTIMALLIFLWYRLDAAEVGYRRSAWLDIGVVGIAIVALPYYLVRSRGAKKGIVGVGALLLMYVASVLLSWFGSYLAYYVLQSG